MKCYVVVLLEDTDNIYFSISACVDKIFLSKESVNNYVKNLHEDSYEILEKTIDK